MRKTGKAKVLMELRTCFEGFAGIPQETRLVFHALNNLENVEVTGLINSGYRHLFPGLRRKKGLLGEPKPHRRVYRLSRVALSVKADATAGKWEQFVRYLEKRSEVHRSYAAASLGLKIPVYKFDASDFGDFIWQLFSKTLPARDFEMVRGARYATIKPSWHALMDVAIRKTHVFRAGRLSSLDTRGYDVFLSQTPWPTNLARNTQLVVRYHDAIPLFLPHTIPNARFHQASHMASLRVSQKRGIFACISNATRDDLLKVFPGLEKRAVVIPDVVSHEYYQESGNEKYISNIIRNNIASETEPKFLTSREKENFYQKNLTSKPPRFILMVSSLEPRKNHTKLIGAWDYLKNHGMPDLKLVMVSSLGWGYDQILKAMAPWQHRGELFHLHRVPSGQLRILFNAAEAVVCPSVYEGFDLSGIEAMLCGGAVVASDIPVHREIYGDACEYFNPYSAIELARAVENVIRPDRRGRREELVAAGLMHAPRYKRENIAPYWHELFERVRRGEYRKAFDRLGAPDFADAGDVPVLGNSLAGFDELETGI